jgi:hypothetical protein
MEQNQSSENPDELSNKLLEGILSELKKITAARKFGFTIRFIEGICYGLGATVGLAIVVAIISFSAGMFGGIPVVGNWLIELGKALHSTGGM